MSEQYYLEDMKIGAVFRSPSKTITEAHFLFFAGLTGDNHPLHYDLEYCKAHGWPERLSHGLLNMAQTCLGASELAGHVHESMIAFLEQSARFTGPVFIGDTIHPTLTVAQVAPRRTTGILRLRAELHNQRRELVLEGEHVYLMRKRPTT
jgi:acyl dehydratase